MYDWPEVRDETDAFWTELCEALAAIGIDTPVALDRDTPDAEIWRSPGLILSQTCGWPLTHGFSDALSVVAIPSYDAEGCGAGTYRSAIVAREKADPLELAHRTIAINGEDSLSGYRALAGWFAGHGVHASDVGDWIETGSHRTSIRAVAAGRAAIASIDCVTWRLALDHEPAARELTVIGWTDEMPALPLVTAKANAGLADVLRAALDMAIARAPQPLLQSVQAGSIEDYQPVIALGETVRAAGY